MLALGVAVEGCSEFMTPLMSHIWPVIEAGLHDGDKSVRKATCVAVSCLCEWLEEECIAKHAVLVPVSTEVLRLDTHAKMYARFLGDHELGARS